MAGPVRPCCYQLNALYVQHGIDAASDDVTGAWLDPALVREGRAVEMKFFSDMGAYHIVPRFEQLETGGKHIGTKWVDETKGITTTHVYAAD